MPYYLGDLEWDPTVEYYPYRTHLSTLIEALNRLIDNIDSLFKNPKPLQTFRDTCCSLSSLGDTFSGVPLPSGGFSRIPRP